MNHESHKPHARKTRQIFLIVFLFAWPIVLVVTALQPIYGLVGSDVDQATVEKMISTASLLVQIGLTAIPISWAIGIYLLVKTLRAK